MMINHIRRWNIWRKHNMNNCLHKLLVLFKLIYSPTFAFVLLPEEENKIVKEFQDALKGETNDQN